MKSKIFVIFSNIESTGNQTICRTNLNTICILIPDSYCYCFLSQVLIYFIFSLSCIFTFIYLNILFISDYIIFTWISFFRISEIILRKKFLFFFSSVRNSKNKKKEMEMIIKNLLGNNNSNKNNDDRNSSVECAANVNLSKESSIDAVNCGSTRSGKCFESHADTIIPFRVGTFIWRKSRSRSRSRRIRRSKGRRSWRRKEVEEQE